MGIVLLYQLTDRLMDQAKPFKHILHLREFDSIHRDQSQFSAIHFQQAVAHHLGTGVDS